MRYLSVEVKKLQAQIRKLEQEKQRGQGWTAALSQGPASQDGFFVVMTYDFAIKVK